MNHLEKTIKEFDEKYFVGGKNALGYEVPLLFPAKSEIREFLITSHIDYLKREMENITFIIEEQEGNDEAQFLRIYLVRLQLQLSLAEQLLNNK